ncbi:LrgB family protein [Sporomusa acidovorans]|uniref:Inner membrane protein YohK n=1 Tax=Sporomusa acidovorans (strain ATCC 49682 / DSM 3132 / Mol) TaxID=1123286 RepID=A0ABZ3IZY7_SPOA4|nr:LrgB family protein [Sporomusa acidovorans]OZC14780.1 inner membrane protein YohK [Sporomusa acidovorans DSM 3132]SDD69292.1 TIGR00659 family protein [Sporomusa acidovorans]
MFALLSVSITIILYKLLQHFYHQFSSVFLLPILSCPILLIAGLKLFHISYDLYDPGAALLSSMLQPATVALAVPLYKYRRILRFYLPELAVSIVCGAVFAMVTSLMMSKLLHLDPQMMQSLAPRSITTPLAIDVSRQLGGIPALTAVFVIFTGITGSMLSPVVFRSLKHVSPITKGLILGVAAHGTGTAKAQEYGKMETAIASLAMIFAGIITTLLAPGFVPLLLQLMGTT